MPRADPKRLRMDQILLGMTGMGLEATHAGSSGGGGASHAHPGMRQRFRLVTTFELSALEVR